MRNWFTQQQQQEGKKEGRKDGRMESLPGSPMTSVSAVPQQQHDLSHGDSVPGHCPQTMTSGTGAMLHSDTHMKTSFSYINLNKNICQVSQCRCQSEDPQMAARSDVCSRGKGAGRYSRSRDIEVESRYSSSCSLPGLRVLILTCPDSLVGALARGLEHECAVP
ncbi:hypothetical protein Baya_10338 [Bagarius yarrelli]|uniref:Uncharacterized protein n=1 Tax=Bagarius yarrelli TaxID=175774 RepID=A0A556UYU8_BAGYA|nr:hypothetical protein Baya_10338 [Bagarius yarrelli]